MGRASKGRAFALEDYFRRKEEEVLKLMLMREQIVLALGGGTLHFGQNAQYVQEYFQKL